MPGVSGNLGKLIEGGFEIFFAGQADEFFGNFTVVEDYRGGNGADTELDGGVAVFVGVDFSDFGGSLVFIGDFLDRGRQHAAGSTPFGPKIDQYRLGAFGYFSFKIIVG